MARYRHRARRHAGSGPGEWTPPDWSAGPHTLVLDEATALLNPGAVRHLDRSLNAVLKGPTMMTIVHRLNTAHDANWVCVVIDRRDRQTRYTRRAYGSERRVRTALG